MLFSTRMALAAVLVMASMLTTAGYAQTQEPRVGRLFPTSQDRIYQARQRAAKASRIATQIETNTEVEQVDYSVLDAQPSVEMVEPGVQYMDEGGMIVEEGMHPGHVHGGGCDSCGTGDCGPTCGGCGQCDTCCMTCIPLCFKLNWDDFSVNAGVQGFKNGLNRGMDGSFGYNYGFNWGMPIGFLPKSGLGFQIGMSGSNANLYGASFTESTRDQTFFTVGLFRRVDWGWQGGVVFDHLKDQWYYDVEVSQVRGQLSWVFPGCNEIGFQFSASDKEGSGSTTITVPGTADVNIDVDETVGATNLYTFFWRHRLDNCGKSFRLFGGWTGDSQGILGADAHLPLTQCLALDSGFTFLLPDAQDDRTRNEEEAWNIGINLVWYPFSGSKCGSTSYYRPLFNVANNGDFILRRQ
ncbi:hypothetical protein LOC68_01395 [Blastopirellula sp. JC732]|uniref:Uncharacterized protein n=1 Tax=Blastopirellula sediminis TaxID=2894196 RepID=A0A9X1MKC0_9BACT|nr:DUF6666 family protein [Blastopirellula sediminis]MCC9608158.1 hypothetical protein [Blastopirellula sediminis]MCC9627049.1 hypothetical protein [Blastopirellula sediminis]